MWGMEKKASMKQGLNTREVEPEKQRHGEGQKVKTRGENEGGREYEDHAVNFEGAPIGEDRSQKTSP